RVPAQPGHPRSSGNHRAADGAVLLRRRRRAPPRIRPPAEKSVRQVLGVGEARAIPVPLPGFVRQVTSLDLTPDTCLTAALAGTAAAWAAPQPVVRRSGRIRGGPERRLRLACATTDRFPAGPRRRASARNVRCCA